MLQYPALAGQLSLPSSPPTDPVPPRGLADMILAGPGAREMLAGRRHIDTTRAVALVPNVTQSWTCPVRLNEAEELLVEVHQGEGMAGRDEGESPLMNVANKAEQNKCGKAQQLYLWTNRWNKKNGKV